jgi:hypothetical protein
MTKLEELKINRADAGYAADVCAADATYDDDARADAQAAVDATYDDARADALDAALDAYFAEVEKIHGAKGDAA